MIIELLHDYLTQSLHLPCAILAHPDSSYVNAPDVLYVHDGVYVEERDCGMNVIVIDPESPLKIGYSKILPDFSDPTTNAESEIIILSLVVIAVLHNENKVELDPQFDGLMSRIKFINLDTTKWKFSYYYSKCYGIIVE